MMLVALLLTACSQDEKTETPKEPTLLNIYVYMPERPIVTRADVGEVNPIQNDVDESKITSLQIWVFNHTTRELVSYLKPEDGSIMELNGNTPGKTYQLSVSEAFEIAKNKPTVDVYVVANMTTVEVGAISKLLGEDTDAETLDAAVLNGQYGLNISGLTSKVPDSGLPMAGVARNVSVSGTAPVYKLSSVKLTRIVSKLRFVLSRESSADEEDDVPVTIKNITLDAGMIPTSEYVFLADDNKPYHIGTEYNAETYDFLGTQLDDIKKNDDPMAYAYQAGKDAQTYEDMIATGVENNKLTQIGPYYLFESDRQLSGTITYQAKNEEAKTATFKMSDAGDFSRNHTWIVYAYYGGTRLEVISVYVEKWTDHEVDDRGIYNW